MARIAGVPPATAQGWLNGRHFPVPALRPNYLRMVADLGLVDSVPADLWGESWTALRPRLREGRTPYLGLRPFEAADHDLYFGRRRESRRLAEAVLEQGRSGLIAVVGASGSGKSSLLAAGLIGTEAANGLLVGRSVVRMPTIGLTTNEPVGSGDVIVLDQFEDLLGLDKTARDSGLSRLSDLIADHVVVLGLRADAFAAAAQEPILAAALARPFLVAPLDRDEVREVIAGPAERSGAQVDEELIRVVTDDLAPGSQVGAAAVDVLPLLSNALLVTWATGSGERMTLADYLRSGGVGSAVQGLAEDLFQSLDPVQQIAAQRLLLRLVRVSGDLLVRESLRLADVDESGRQVLDAFATARMLTTTDDSVRISHDALLTHWSRLRGWISEHRADLAVVESLRRAAQVWWDSGCSPDALIPVERMEVFGEWLADPRRERLLSDRESGFILASRKHFASELAREHRLNRRLRRSRNLAVALTALAVTLALVTGLSYWQGLGLRAAAESARLDSQSRQVALEARSLRKNDANLIGQMAMVANRLSDTRQGRSLLIDATAMNVPIRWLGAPEAVVAALPDGQLIARANGRGQVTLWRGDEIAGSPGNSFVADPAGRPLYGLALASMAGRRLLAVGGQQVASLWDVSGEPVMLADLRTESATAYGLAFDPARRRLAVAYSTGRIELWSLREPGAPTLHATLSLGPPAVPARAVAFSSATGDLFVAGPPDAIARWSLGSRPKRLPNLSFRRERIAYGIEKKPVLSQTVAVSPDGRQVVAGIQGVIVPRWRIDGTRANPDRPLAVGGFANDVSFSSDGKTLLVGSSDQFVYVFDAASGKLRQRLGDSAVVTGVEMVGSRPVSTGQDGALRVWQPGDTVLRTGSTVYGLSTDAKDRYLAASTVSNGVQLWDRSSIQPRRLPDPAFGAKRAPSSAVAVAPSGAFLVAGTSQPQGEVLSWPLSGSGAGEPAVVSAFPGWYVGVVAISPDSATVAALQYNGDQIALYRADSQGRLTPAARLAAPTPQSLSFSADGDLLAIPVDGERVQLWDVGDPTRPSLAGMISGLDTFPTMALFGNSSRTLAIGTASGEVTIWDATDPAAPVRRRSLGDSQAWINSLALSPDDRTLVAGGGDNLVWAWRLDRDETEAYLTLDGKIGRTQDVRILDGGRTLIAGGGDGLIKTWLLRPEDARTALCAARGTPLTADEWRRYLPGVTPSDPC